MRQRETGGTGWCIVINQRTGGRTVERFLSTTERFLSTVMESHDLYIPRQEDPSPSGDGSVNFYKRLYNILPWRALNGLSPL